MSTTISTCQLIFVYFQNKNVDIEDVLHSCNGGEESQYQEFISNIT